MNETTTVNLQLLARNGEPLSAPMPVRMRWHWDMDGISGVNVDPVSLPVTRAGVAVYVEVEHRGSRLAIPIQSPYRVAPAPDRPVMTFAMGALGLSTPWPSEPQRFVEDIVDRLSRE